MEQTNECKSKVLECVKKFPAHKLKEFMSQWDCNDDSDKWKEIKDQDLILHIEKYISTLDYQNLESFEKQIFKRLENLKGSLKYKATERIKNLSDKTLERFSDFDPDLKNFFAAQENIGLNVKSKFENYIETLSDNALALEKFLSDLSDFVKADVIREFDEAYKNLSSSKLKDAATEFEDHRFEGHEGVRFTLYEIENADALKEIEKELKDNFGFEIKKGSSINLKVFCENISKWEGRWFKPRLDKVLKDVLDNMHAFCDSCFQKFETGNYYGGNCYKSDWLCSAKLFYCLNKAGWIKNKRREFLSKLDLNVFMPEKEYGKLELNNINLNADEPETEKTCLRWKEIYIIKYVSQIKNILFNKEISDTEKINRINGLTKNITWDEFKKISVYSPGKSYTLSCSKNKAGEGQVPAYLFLYEFFWIYATEFYNLIESDKDLKEMFDCKKIMNLISYAEETSKLIRVLNFIIALIGTVISFGILTKCDNVKECLKSISESYYQRNRNNKLKELLAIFKTLPEGISKTTPKSNEKPLSNLKGKSNNNGLHGEIKKADTYQQTK